MSFFNDPHRKPPSMMDLTTAYLRFVFELTAIVGDSLRKASTKAAGFLSRARKSQRTSRTEGPPENLKFLLKLLFRDNEQEAAVGDFLERYASKLERIGKRRAKRWAYLEVIRTLGGVVKRAILKISGSDAAAEWVRRNLS